MLPSGDRPQITSSNTAADNYLYGAALPVITAVAPGSGPLSGGNTVTITGTGFTGATSVTFGGTAGSSLSVASDTSLTVVAPAHAAGVVDIVVTTPIGSNTNTALACSWSRASVMGLDSETFTRLK